MLRLLASCLITAELNLAVRISYLDFNPFTLDLTQSISDVQAGSLPWVGILSRRFGGLDFFLPNSTLQLKACDALDVTVAFSLLAQLHVYKAG